MSAIEIQRRQRPPHPSSQASEERVIGETVQTSAGYFLRVSAVQLDRAGQRVRIALYQRGTFVRHLDVTPDLAVDLGRILGKAKG